MSRFDEIIDRRSSYSTKYDKLKIMFGREDLIPMWVADMEFKSPECIKEALQKFVDCGVYGYNVEPKEMRRAIIGWLETEQKWKAEDPWMSFIPGIVRGISFVVHYFTQKGDKILVQPPVYHPFMLVPKNNDRELVFNPLRLTEPVAGGEGPVMASQMYSIDFENFEKVTDENDCKMFILCNPHNPGGVRWSREDLVRIAEICYRKHILVISDEIHADLQLWGGHHIPFASVSEEAAQNSITFGAPSKTFNIPGLGSSFAIVPNDELRSSFYHWLEVNELNTVPLPSALATIAAYTDGISWHREVIKYIEDNIIFTEQFLKENMPSIRAVRPETSYLVWLDCRKFTTDQSKLVDYFVNKAHIALNDGTMYGTEGTGFMRLNVACPRKMLEKALEQLAHPIGF